MFFPLVNAVCECCRKDFLGFNPFLWWRKAGLFVQFNRSIRPNIPSTYWPTCSIYQAWFFPSTSSPTAPLIFCAVWNLLCPCFSASHARGSFPCAGALKTTALKQQTLYFFLINKRRKLAGYVAYWSRIGAWLWGLQVKQTANHQEVSSAWDSVWVSLTDLMMAASSRSVSVRVQRR